MSFEFRERLTGRLFSRSARRSTLKGRMQNIIVVKPPDPMFRQAVFFLRDDYFVNSDISRAELLSQAEEAAVNFVAANIPAQRRKKALRLSALVILSSAALTLILFLILK